MGPGQASTLFLPPSTIHFMTCERNNMTADNRDFDVFEISRKVIENGDYPKVQIVQKDGNWFTLNNLQLEVCRRLEQDGLCTQVKADIIPISEIPDELRKMMVLPQNPPPVLSPETETTSSSLPPISKHLSSSTNDTPDNKTTEIRGASVNTTELPSGALSSSSMPLSPRPCSRETDDDTSRVTGRGYQKLCQKEKADKPATETDDDDESQCSDSEDSECDDDCDSDCDWSDDDDDDDQENSSDYDSSGEERESTDDERECLL
ncbi:uncharacterized protein LOC141903809 [Tubulanus polymorphus]|uniref:uncharacterized protein LOC141903809 n=1 Tax=Tubulanus polymorphus TaxID=672921 RepID=UPI003DA33F1E